MVDAKQVRRFHDQAMELAQEAYVEKDPAKARELHEAAFANERKAAELLREEYALEPSRSVLYRSAATLAMRCENFSEAERLARAGLSGNPPGGIAHELRDVLKQVHRATRKHRSKLQAAANG